MTQDNLEQNAPPRAEPEHDGKPRRKAPVFVYLALLFVAAFLMLVLAYFIQERDESVLSSGARTDSAAVVLDVSRETSGWDVSHKTSFRCFTENITGGASIGTLNK